MPSRIMRAEINRSHSLSRVSLQADLMFRALILEADDYGRLDARAAILKAQLFPLREISHEEIDAWLSELIEEGCVYRYTVEDRPYLELTGWEKHRGKGRRSAISRYPSPNSADPRISRKSEDLPESPRNPPGGRGTGDGGRWTLDGGRGTGSGGRADRAPARGDSTPTHRTSFPEGRRDRSELLADVRAMAEPELTLGQIRYGLRAIERKARANGYTKVSWPDACYGWLIEGWPLKGYVPPGQDAAILTANDRAEAARAAGPPMTAEQEEQLRQQIAEGRAKRERQAAKRALSESAGAQLSRGARAQARGERS